MKDNSLLISNLAVFGFAISRLVDAGKAYEDEGAIRLKINKDG